MVQDRFDDSSQGLAEAEWIDSDSVCALADGERHLGHVVRVGMQWHAFDGTHSNEEGNGFRSLGSFINLKAAKAAIEACCLRPEVSFAYAGAA